MSQRGRGPPSCQPRGLDSHLEGPAGAPGDALGAYPVAAGGGTTEGGRWSPPNPQPLCEGNALSVSHPVLLR